MPNRINAVYCKVPYLQTLGNFKSSKTKRRSPCRGLNMMPEDHIRKCLMCTSLFA